MSLAKAASTLTQPLQNLGTWYVNAAAKRPFTVGVLTTGIKTSAADLFTQMVMEGCSISEIDWKRQGAFTFFGFAYLGVFQYFFYTRLLTPVTEPISRTMGHIASAPIKVLLDQGLHHPFLYFPSFYLLKHTLVQGDPADKAFAKYKEELWPNCKALWTIWVPGQLLNFGIMPAHLQIPTAAGISFVWTIVLSMMRGKMDDSDSDAKPIEAEPETAQSKHSSNKASSKEQQQGRPKAASVLERRQSWFHTRQWQSAAHAQLPPLRSWSCPYDASQVGMTAVRASSASTSLQQLRSRPKVQEASSGGLVLGPDWLARFHGRHIWRHVVLHS